MTTEAKPVRHETGIQWTQVPGYVGATWNPTTGCSRVSPGCDHCYAFTLHDARYKKNLDAARAHPPISLRDLSHGPDLIGAKRREDASALPFPAQYDVPFSTVQVLGEERLREPLRTRRPHAYFVDSMADLFHEDVPDAFLARVFAVMALSPQHIFQILTKRPERMREYVTSGRATPVGMAALEITLEEFSRDPRSRVGQGTVLTGDIAHLRDWPLRNVWLGVSAEDQARADERIPVLLDTPAAVRFISAEPLLGAIDLEALWPGTVHSRDFAAQLDWVIVGGESGPRARAFDVAWARSLRDQCASAGVPFFMKQMGRAPVETSARGLTSEYREFLHLRNAHGADMEEWPADLRVREFPTVVAATGAAL